MATLEDWTKAHRSWVDDFVLSLRSAGATSEEIADRLSAVHAQCDDVDRFPEDEYGDAESYVRSLGFEPKSTEKRGILHIALPVVVQVLLLLVGSYAIRDWITGTDLVVNMGTLICWIVLVAMVGVTTATTAWGSTAIYNAWVFDIVFGIAIVMGVAGAVLSRADLPMVFSGTPVLLAVVAILGVLAIAVISTLRLKRSTSPLVLAVFWVIPLFMAIDAGFTALNA